MDKQARLKRANEFIKTIASCGRKFFSHKERVAKLELSEHGRVFFIDDYSQERIYTHYSGYWGGFSQGGTMQMIIENLRDYIIKDQKMAAGYFQPMMHGGSFRNPWGYGDDILKVRESAVKLRIALE